MKKKYLFYWEETVSAFVPAPERIGDIIDVDSLFPVEEQEIRFVVFEMTEQEFENLPES